MGVGVIVKGAGFVLSWQNVLTLAMAVNIIRWCTSDE